MPLVRQLAQKADIFMCNLLTKRQQKFGLDPDSLFKANPNLRARHPTGYGTSGPDAWRPGYDVTAFFGRSGLYDSMREGDDGMVPMARLHRAITPQGLPWLALFGARRDWRKTGEAKWSKPRAGRRGLRHRPCGYCGRS